MKPSLSLREQNERAAQQEASAARMPMAAYHEHKREEPPRLKAKTRLATIGSIARPLRVRARYHEGRQWWAVIPEDTWPGMVMDLRRLGLEAKALGDEVLFREVAAVPVMEPVEGGRSPLPEIPASVYIHPDESPDLADFADLEDLWGDVDLDL